MVFPLKIIIDKFVYEKLFVPSKKRMINENILKHKNKMFIFWLCYLNDNAFMIGYLIILSLINLIFIIIVLYKIMRRNYLWTVWIQFLKN